MIPSALGLVRLESQSGFEFWLHLTQLLFDHKNVLTVHQVIHKHGR